MLRLIFKLLSLLPLPILHLLGKALGTILFHTASKAKRLTVDNMAQSQLFPEPLAKAVRQSFSSLGRAILETPFIWNSDNQKIAKLVKKVHGWEAVEASINSNKSAIFLTPHMGCFEITLRYFALHHPITALYRPPKKTWLAPLVNIGRARNNITLAKANASGVRKLMKTLKKGGAVGILPDQKPSAGEGEWADFFNKPAYTMTLASKLAEKTDAAVFTVFGERLENGKGYDLHFTKVDSIATTQQLNNAIETQIKQSPHQYYWSYHRYKVSRKSKGKPQKPTD